MAISTGRCMACTVAMSSTTAKRRSPQPDPAARSGSTCTVATNSSNVWCRSSSTMLRRASGLVAVAGDGAATSLAKASATASSPLTSGSGSSSSTGITASFLLISLHSVCPKARRYQRPCSCAISVRLQCSTQWRPVWFFHECCRGQRAAATKSCVEPCPTTSTEPPRATASAAFAAFRWRVSARRLCRVLPGSMTPTTSGYSGTTALVYARSRSAQPGSADSGRARSAGSGSAACSQPCARSSQKPNSMRIGRQSAFATGAAVSRARRKGEQNMAAMGATPAGRLRSSSAR
mmetsp:Transcript_77860/g.231969  ORF Transcript_77860/g.231969 Transcript_77860/m.231969 type:complete len:292 (-) Transcript_77860:70-945(-)